MIRKTIKHIEEGNGLWGDGRQSALTSPEDSGSWRPLFGERFHHLLIGEKMLFVWGWDRVFQSLLCVSCGLKFLPKWWPRNSYPSLFLPISFLFVFTKSWSLHNPLAWKWLGSVPQVQGGLEPTGRRWFSDYSSIFPQVFLFLIEYSCISPESS